MSKFQTMLTTIFLLLALVSNIHGQQQNANFKLSLSNDFLTKMAKKLVPQILTKFSSVSIPNQTSTHCLLHNMKADMSEIDETDIELKLNPSTQTLTLKIKELNLFINMIFDCQDSFLNVRGGGSAQGHISLNIDLEIRRNEKGQPSINILKTVPYLVSKEFQIKLECKDCPSYVKNALQSLVQVYALPAGQIVLRYLIEVDIKTEINHILSTKYLLTQEIKGQDMSIATDLVTEPKVVYDHVQFDINGRFFKTSSPNEKITINNLNSIQIPTKSRLSNDMNLDVNLNAISQAFQIMKQKNLSANFNFYGFNVDVNIPSNELSYLDISNGHLVFTGTPNLKLTTIATGNLKYTFSSTMNLFFNLVSYQPDNQSDSELLKLQLADIRLVTFKFLDHNKEKTSVSFITDLMRYCYRILQNYGMVQKTESDEEGGSKVVSFNFSFFVVLFNFALSFMRNIYGFMDFTSFNHMWTIPVFEIEGFSVKKLKSELLHNYGDIEIQADYIGNFE